MRCGTRDKRCKNRVGIRLEMIEFEASSLGSKLIGLLFQDSQDYAPHPLED